MGVGKAGWLAGNHLHDCHPTFVVADSVESAGVVVQFSQRFLREIRLLERRVLRWHGR